MELVDNGDGTYAGFAPTDAPVVSVPGLEVSQLTVTTPELSFQAIAATGGPGRLMELHDSFVDYAATDLDPVSACMEKMDGR